MFELYSSDSDDEMQLNWSDIYSRRRRDLNNNTMSNNEPINKTEQLRTWNYLKLHIDKAINELNLGNIRYTRIKLYQQNIVRGKGLFCRSILNAQSASIDCTNTYATLVSFINLEFPNIVELLLVRCITTFLTACNLGKPLKCVAPAMFIAYLVKYRVTKDSLALDLIKALLKSPTSQSLYVVANIMKVCCKKFNSNPENKSYVKYVFDMLENLSHNNHINKSVRTLTRVLFKTYKQSYEDELKFHLIDPCKQYTHLLTLNGKYDPQYELDDITYDLDYMYYEILYTNMTRRIMKIKSKIYFYVTDENSDDEMDSKK